MKTLEYKTSQGYCYSSHDMEHDAVQFSQIEVTMAKLWSLSSHCKSLLYKVQFLYYVLITVYTI